MSTAAAVYNRFVIEQVSLMSFANEYFTKTVPGITPRVTSTPVLVAMAVADT